MNVFTFLLLKLALFLSLNSNKYKHKDNIYIKHKRRNVSSFVRLYKTCNSPDQEKGLSKRTPFLVFL